MRRQLLFICFFVFLTVQLTAQIEDRLRALDETEVNKYVEPMATAVGMAFNSGGYTTAYIPKTFGFSIGADAVLIFVPESDTKFKTDLPNGYNNSRETATIFGNSGGYYAGPGGYIPYPPGINRTTIPAVFPQATLSFAGTRLIFRFLPKLDVGETEVGMFGFGIAHSISQYIPEFPIDLAVQGLYSKISATNIVDHTNLAFNIHGSREFGIFTLYSGIQYEQSRMELDYLFSIKDPLNPGQFIERNIKANVDGRNNFRFTAGGALRLLFIVIHADISASSQITFNTGLSLEF
jgi:hypothetical protein